MKPSLSSSALPCDSRRRVSAGILGLVATGFVIRSHAQSSRLHPTPRVSEGPFYPDRMPADADFDLLKNGNTSQVTDTSGVPIKGAAVEIWQCDMDGHYLHSSFGARLPKEFQGFGRAVADGEGQYRFRTMRPAIYAGRTPHIHVKVWVGKQDMLTTQLFVQGDPGNARDFLWRSLNGADQQAVGVAFKPGSDGMSAQFPLVLSV
jgi:protocatechuate 3,4-dioxygenase, beta subunit